METNKELMLFEIGKKIGYTMFAIASTIRHVENLKERFEHIDCDDILENLDIAYVKLQEI